MIGPPPISSITRLVFIQKIHPSPHDLQVSQTFSAHKSKCSAKVAQDALCCPPHVISSSGFPHIFCPQIRRQIDDFFLHTGGGKNRWAAAITHYRDLVLPSTIFSTKHPAIHSASLKRTPKDMCYQQRKETLEFNSRK